MSFDLMFLTLPLQILPLFQNFSFCLEILTFFFFFSKFEDFCLNFKLFSSKFELLSRGFDISKFWVFIKNFDFLSLKFQAHDSKFWLFVSKCGLHTSQIKFSTNSCFQISFFNCNWRSWASVVVDRNRAELKTEALLL